MYHLLMYLFQVCSYDAPGTKTCLAPSVTSLNIGTKKKNFRILFLLNWKAYSFDTWYAASPSGPPPSSSNDVLGVKTGPALGVTSSNIVLPYRSWYS